VDGIPEFHDARFTDPSDFRAYRCLLYLFVRTIKPRIMIETGVHNGFSTAFLLQGVLHNGIGRIISVDLPPVEQRIIEQGTRPLPKDRSPGWAIPDRLRRYHDLRLGPAEFLLPQVFSEVKTVDAFLHDSDHSYSHMAFEMGLAWRFIAPGGWLLADNVEQNKSFEDFTVGVGVERFVVASFDSSERTWQHGMCRKPL
jgi:predicted O-methyltransferase YrrM